MRTYTKKSARSAVTEKVVLKIRELASENLSVRKIATYVQIPKSTIHDILSGKTWAHVPDPVTVYKDYIVYPDGRIFSKKTNKLLSNRLTKQGTLTVELTINGTKKTLPVAAVVAKAFLGSRATKLSFIDNDATNVHFTNIVTR